MAIFFLAEIKAITNEDMYREYVGKAAPIVEKHGGEYIFRSDLINPISGDWNPKRMILIRFPSEENVRECFQSAEYRAIAHLRENSTQSNAVIIKDNHPLPPLENSL